MPELSVHALGVAVRPRPRYVPVPALAGPEHVRALAGVVARATGLPSARLAMLAPDPDRAADVAGRALAALGDPGGAQPLFLVRSGPLRDPDVAELARLVHAADWAGEDLGLTHLDELGGTVVFDLLDWAVPDDTGATVLVCDEPAFADAAAGLPPAVAVGLRVRRGPGPLRVAGCGEGEPGPGADHRFSGGGPCDGWLQLHAALAAGTVADGDRVLLETRGRGRTGWLSLLAADVAALTLSTPCLSGGVR